MYSQIVAKEHMTAEQHESRADITVSIEDMNDNWPSFDEDLYRVNIPENSPRNTNITQIRVIYQHLTQPYNQGIIRWFE